MADRHEDGVAVRLPQESKRYRDGVPLKVDAAVSPKRAAKKAASKKAGQSATAPTKEN